MVFHRLIPLYIVVFFGFIGYSMAITVFTPLFISDQSGFLPQNASLSYRTILLGVVLFLYPFGQFLSSPVLGSLSDRFGRKPLLIWTLGLTTVMYAVIAFSLYIENLSLLLLSLFFAGLSEGNVAIAQSSVSDVTHEKERGRYFGYIYFSASLAYIIGPLFGGKLADSTSVSWFSNATPFWLLTVFLLFLFFWIVFVFKETHGKEKRVSVHYFEALISLKNVFYSKNLRVYFLVNFLLYLAIFGFFRCYPMFIVDKFDVGVSKLSEYVAWVAVPIILMNLWVTGVLARKFNLFQMTLGAAFFTGVFLLVFIVPKTQGALWVTLFLCGGAVALALPSAPAFLSSKADKSHLGSVLGNNQSLQFFAEAFSGLLGGLLAAVFIKLSLIVFGILSLLAALILYFSKKTC